MVDRKIFYLHIPKTGGQTLAARISSAFPHSRSSIMSHDLVYPEGVQRLEYLLSNFDFVECHVTGQVLSIDIAADILVTIRSPIEQLISNYLHIKREPLNRLYRVANLYSPEQFFSEYGEFLKNHQSRYLVSAFNGFSINEDRTAFLVSALYQSLNRVRWCVPTESIDEFLSLWSIENRTHVPNTQESINIAPNKERYAELLDIAHRFTYLYSIDLLLWDIVRERYKSYRNRILRDVTGIRYPDNSSKAFGDGDCGVWLRSGWHSPQMTSSNQLEWWAGPDRFSEVSYRKKSHHRFIKFSLSVVCGITREDIIATRESPQDIVPTELKFLGDDRYELWIDIGGLPNEGIFKLCVPEVYSPMMVDAQSDDSKLKSYASVGWAFVE